jgi:hypothetical protein
MSNFHYLPGRAEASRGRFPAFRKKSFFFKPNGVEHAPNSRKRKYIQEKK